MDDKQLKNISKFLSKHLRHTPEALGLTLAEGGWVKVEALLAACQKQRFPITLAQLQEVVAKNDKQRFAFDATGQSIRANQGHSVEVDLQLEPATPPRALYHGTATDDVAIIMQEGLKRMSRHHVHLSVDIETAKKVGTRHGVPVVFAVNAALMASEGFTFYRSANGVWLIDEVPPKYLKRL